MNATLKTPKGTVIRTRTNSRFVLVNEHTTAEGEVEAAIVKRSSNLETLRTAKRRMGNSFYRDGSSSVLHIFDTFNGEVLR